MSLTDEEIITEIASYMHGYLKEGRLSIQPFIQDVSITLDSIKDLLKIKFLLQEETLKFVETLPKRLRRFKTTTVSIKETIHSDIRGRIIWQDSLQERYRSGNDQTVYVISEQNRSYDTDENLVLKETLVIFEQLLYKEKTLSLLEKTNWGNHWKDLGHFVKNALHKNSYIERVSYQRTTRKQRQRASQHRLPVYRDASNVLKNYYRLMRGEYSEKELVDVLNATFVMTDNRDTLMELYWTIQLIKERTESGTYFMMAEGNTKVAQWQKGESIYTISHNTSGPDDLLFSIPFDELESIDHPIIKQLLLAKNWSDKISKELFGTHYTRGLWSGRPDILIEKRCENNNLQELIIGEVKNTTNKNYAKQGLWELSEYIHLLRSSQTVFINEELSVKGILCLGNIDIAVKTVDVLEVKTLDK